MASHKASGLPDAAYKISANSYLDPYVVNIEDMTPLTYLDFWLEHSSNQTVAQGSAVILMEGSECW